MSIFENLRFSCKMLKLRTDSKFPDDADFGNALGFPIFIEIFQKL
jgi:hypothetical protein